MKRQISEKTKDKIVLLFNSELRVANSYLWSYGSITYKRFRKHFRN